MSIWPKFPAPKSSTVADATFGSREVPFHRNSFIRETVDRHEFNQSIQVIVPVKVHSSGPARQRVEDVVRETGNVLEEKAPLLAKFLKNKLGNNDYPQLTYFRVTSLPVHFLVHRVFIENYVRRGKIFAIAESSSDIFKLCITSDGVLTMQVSDKLFLRLGLQGNSHASLPGLHTIEVDLSSRCMNNFQSRYYRRVFSRLRESGINVDLLIRWSPKVHFGEGDEPSGVSEHSIRLYFETMKRTETDTANITISICRPSVRLHPRGRFHVSTSLVNLGSLSLKDQIGDVVEDIIDWTGAVVNNIPFSLDRESADVSSFGIHASLCDVVQGVLISTVTGFFAPLDIQILLDEIEKVIYSLPSVPFISVIVNGFQRTPISWRGKNLFMGSDSLSNENLYGICVCRKMVGDGDGTRCLVWRIAGSQDFSIHTL